MATCAAIVNIKLADNEGEDSFSLLPLFQESNTSNFLRESTVHHSINGSFAIRKGKWKMIFCPGSGGWSSPKPNSKEVLDLPVYQLYDLESDPEEKNNVYSNNSEVSEQLKQLMITTINDGRSTVGAKQQNEPEGYGNKQWNQLEKLIN